MGKYIRNGKLSLSVRFQVIAVGIWTLFYMYRIEEYRDQALGLEIEQVLKQKVRRNEVKHDERIVLAIDLWERLVHTEWALRRLVRIGKMRGFKVVEPLVYQARVGRAMGFEGDFREKGLQIQGADTYFDTWDLERTGWYVKRDEWRRRMGGMGNVVMEVGVWIMYGDSGGWRECAEGGYERDPFLGWKLSKGVYVKQMVCIGEWAWDWDMVFNRTGANMLVMMNLRKYLLARSPVDAKDGLQSVMMVSEWGRKEAQKLRQRLFGKKKVVAVQMRTGKIFDVLNKYEKSKIQQGTNMTRFQLFERWLNRSVEQLMKEVNKGEEWGIYLASDIYHDGWRGGEYCPKMVKGMLERVKQKLERWGGRAGGWDGEDEMGRSAVVDAAVCVEADEFVFVTPSSMGGWISWQRRRMGRESRIVAGAERWDERLKLVWQS